MLAMNDLDFNPLTIETEYTGCGIHSILETFIRALSLLESQDQIQFQIEQLANPNNNNDDNWLLKAKYLLAIIIKQSLNVLADTTIDITEFWVYINSDYNDKPEPLACFTDETKKQHQIPQCWNALMFLLFDGTSIQGISHNNYIILHRQCARGCMVNLLGFECGSMVCNSGNDSNNNRDDNNNINEHKNNDNQNETDDQLRIINTGDKVLIQFKFNLHLQHDLIDTQTQVPIQRAIDLSLTSLSSKIFDTVETEDLCSVCNEYLLEYKVSPKFQPTFLAVTVGFCTDNDGLKSDRKITQLEEIKFGDCNYKVAAIVMFVFFVIFVLSTYFFIYV